jgi:hypothetical protein
MKLKALKLVLAGLAIAGLGSAVAFAMPTKNPHSPSITTTGTTTTKTTGKGHKPSTNTTGKGHKPSTTTAATTTVAAATTTTKTTGKGHKPSTTGVGCKPQVSLIVKGTATADAGASTLSLNVTGGNHWAKLLFANNTTTTVSVNTAASTQVVTGTGTTTALSSIKKSDRVLVQYRVCKADVTGAKTAGTLSTLATSLTPKKVVKLG